MYFHIHLIRPLLDNSSSPPQLERHSARLLINPLLAKGGLHMHRRAALLGKQAIKTAAFASVCPSLCEVMGRSMARAAQAAPSERAPAVGCGAEPAVQWRCAAFPCWLSPGFPGTCGTPRAAAWRVRTEEKGAAWSVGQS